MANLAINESGLVFCPCLQREIDADYCCHGRQGFKNIVSPCKDFDSSVGNLLICTYEEEGER